MNSSRTTRMAPVDPLAEVFSLLQIRSAASSRLEAGGAWALRFPAQPFLKFNAVVRGECWIVMAGRRPHRLQAGDSYLLSNSPSYVLTTDLQLEPQDGAALFAKSPSKIVRYHGTETALLGGGFEFQAGTARLVLDRLPHFVCIPAQEPAAAILRNTLQLLDEELINNRMGASVMTRRLADILLVQTLRAYVASHGIANAGWLGALSDRRIGTALTILHGDVSRNWQVGDLAARVGMSRSGFALRFKALVGVPPLEYLTLWRMEMARDALRRNEGSITSIALQVGYGSESAFSNAFKRLYGRAPGRYWSSN
jgi:AraC-like DNA-binding protein